MNRKEAPWGFVEKYYTDDLNERDSPETKFYLSFLRYVKGRDILCLGCGPNLYDDVKFFSNFPNKIVGIDINKNNIEFLKTSQHPELLKIKKLLYKNKVKAELIIGDILKPRKDFVSNFDVVYAIGVVGMFKEEELKKLLKMIYSYLKPRGLFLDVDWTDCQLSEKKYQEREGYQWYSNQGPSIERLGEVIEQANFKIIKKEIYDVSNKKKYLWGKIYGYLARK